MRAARLALVIAAVLVLAFAACGDSSAGSDAGPGADADPGDLCADRPCLTRVADEAAWDSISVTSTVAARCDFVSESKYLAPATAEAALQSLVFLDVGVRRFHLEFMQLELPGYFGGLTTDVYARLVQRRATREYWAGSLFRIADAGGQTLGWAFDVIVDPTAPSERLDADEIAAIQAQLAAGFSLPLGYAPTTADAIADAQAFVDLGFPVYLPRACDVGTCDDPALYCVNVPAAISLCGQFREGRSLAEEQAVKIRVTVAPQVIDVPPDGRVPVEATLFTGGSFGPEQTALVAAGAGTLVRTAFGWDYAQTLSAGADSIELHWNVPFADQPSQVVFAEPWLSQHFYAIGAINGGVTYEESVSLGSCTAESFGLNRITATLDGGDQLTLDVRYDVPLAGSGTLLPLAAEVDLGREHRSVDDYFALTYAAEHHNWNNNFWILFDAPVTDGADAVWGLWIDEAEYSCCPAEIWTLDEEHAALRQREVVDYAWAVVP